MLNDQELLERIKHTVTSTEPGATVILFGSHARGDNTKDSDIDLLILVDKDHLSFSLEQKIKYPLYDIEFETGKIISPLVLTVHEWKKRFNVSPFCYNVNHEGIVL